MKGNEDLLAVLCDLLAAELAAINQYMVHAEMCDNWGCERLHHAVEGRVATEMKHSEQLIARILLLGGKPTVGELKQVQIGGEVDEQLANDLRAEQEAMRRYRAAIQLARTAGEQETAELLGRLLADEERHVKELEAEQERIRKVGVQNYLVEQISKG